MYSVFQLLLWSSLCAVVLQAYDLSKQLDPPGALKVALDYEFATRWPTPLQSSGPQVPRNWVWSSHITFNGPVSEISDGQLWQIALDASDEVDPDRKQYGISPKNQPAAMGVLAWGNEIILASSQKGPTSFSYNYPNTDILLGLQLCQIVWRDYGPGQSDTRHRNDGKCAEQMAAHLYYLSRPRPSPLSRQSARVGTIVRNNKGGKAKTDPCGDVEKDSWGCNLFVADQALTVLDKNTPSESYDLSSLAGGVARIDQITLCGAIRPY
ncbi:hypothetical protein VTK73DRAFT_5581 [Phialemonium thermophilum]|uniref:Uncharacterized protein n=1 Tax=Phialemonium thermophilum TaxID=223376 RepID=A0ABR3WNA6_9PEZI